MANLATKEWRTNITQTSHADGEINARGYLGHYEITVTKGKSVAKEYYELTKNARQVGIK